MRKASTTGGQEREGEDKPEHCSIQEQWGAGGNGRWQMADGRWQMADGRWQMADGRWHMAHGKWQMAHGRWHMADGKDYGRVMVNVPWSYFES